MVEIFFNVEIDYILLINQAILDIMADCLVVCHLHLGFMPRIRTILGSGIVVLFIQEEQTLFLDFWSFLDLFHCLFYVNSADELILLRNINIKIRWRPAILRRVLLRFLQLAVWEAFVG